MFKKEIMMPVTARERLIEEIRDLPPDTQEKIVKLVHFLKEEILAEKKDEPGEKTENKRDIMSLLPRRNMGKILTSMRREDIYTDAR